MIAGFLWPTLGWGLISFVLFYGGAVLIERLIKRRQDRQRPAHLRSRRQLLTALPAPPARRSWWPWRRRR
jgi:hypothetical protein